MHIHDGWLDGATILPSPNHNERPGNTPVSLVVLHNISLPPGEFGGGYIEKFFTNQLDHSLHPYFDTIRDLQVSAHVLVSRTGQITQFVAFNRRAWHAGQSCYLGRSNCNDFSVGIEMEGTDGQPYTDMQYEALNRVIRALQKEYPLTVNALAGHEDIAPGRKTDPGPWFDWGRVRHELTD